MWCSSSPGLVVDHHIRLRVWLSLFLQSHLQHTAPAMRTSPLPSTHTVHPHPTPHHTLTHTHTYTHTHTHTLEQMWNCTMGTHNTLLYMYQTLFELPTMHNYFTSINNSMINGAVEMFPFHAGPTKEARRGCLSSLLT